jgi:glycosyltransferase involved in cell wall biosynthesis
MSVTNLLYKKQYNVNKDIIYSIITPIYNQEKTIVNTITSIINNTQNNFEIILILDFCFDNTEKNIMNFLEKYKNKLDNFIQITVFKNENIPLFETKCDNIGFKNALGKYCLEIQADMTMTEYGYNVHLSKPFLLFDNIIAVSGRCAHNLFCDGGIGKLGTLIEQNINDINVCKNKFYVYETCNRGPLLIDREKIKELNYLNEEDYFLDNSDHDLMARAYIEKKYICGYVPINFDSPLFLGSTRNYNTYHYCNEYWINYQEKQKLREKCSSVLGIKKYEKLWKNREPIVYDI